MCPKDFREPIAISRMCSFSIFMLGIQSGNKDAKKEQKPQRPLGSAATLRRGALLGGIIIISI